MSAKEKKLSGNQWFLRTGPDVVFGPVEKQGLLLWAQQARILPGHEVSTDRKNWKSAVSVEFLDMCWFVDDGDEDFKGPLNRQAAETLVKNGKFSAAARIVSASEVSLENEKDTTPDQKAENSKKEQAQSEKAPVVKSEGRPPKSPVKPSTRTTDVAAKAVLYDAKRTKEVSAKPVDHVRKTMMSEERNESNALKTLRGESHKTITELNKKIRQLEERLRSSESERRQMDVSSVSGESYQNLKKENEVLRRDLVTAQKKVESFQYDMQDRDNRIEKLEGQLNDKRALHAESERKVQEAVQARERALQQSRESERSFARLLSDANKRDVEYKAKIDALKKNITLSPDQTDRFYSDQNAIYQILKRELETLTKTMESERSYLQSLKNLEAERFQELEKRRQMLQNHLGNSPGEMTSRMLREQTVDPNAVRMRLELDTLKIAHERSTHRYEERERDLNHKLKVVQTDYNNLMNQLLEKERDSEILQQLQEKFDVTEKKLAELRKSYDAERKQFIANNNALAARVVELEDGPSGITPGEVQSSEAKGVKLASWMTFRK